MDKLKEIFKLVKQAIENKYGKGTKLEEGDTFVFQLKDCILITSLENGHLKHEFVEGMIIPIDFTTGFFEENNTQMMKEPWKAAVINHFTRTE